MNFDLEVRARRPHGAVEQALLGPRQHRRDARALEGSARGGSVLNAHFSRVKTQMSLVHDFNRYVYLNCTQQRSHLCRLFPATEP